MKSVHIVTAVLVIGLATAACSSPPAPHESPTPSDKYSLFLSEAHDRGQFNGNALVIEDGAVVYHGSFGIGSIDPDAPLDRNSVFRLGSVSKQFTAMGVLILQEQGKLTYDQDLRHFIPELPYAGITVRNLLNHVSGLPDYESLMVSHWKPELDAADPSRYISGNQDIIDVLAEQQPEVHFEPGERWEYSNTGYVMLATIVARASGVPFETFLKEHVFEPAGMTQTVVYAYVLGDDESMPDRVYGYRTSLDGAQRVSNDSHFLNFAQGDGGVYSTLDDLASWDRILYTETLVSRGTLEEAFTPAVLNDGETTDYGFGWSVGQSLSGKKAVSHGGGWVGFRTYIHREIEDDRCIVVLTNNSTKFLGGIVDGLIQLLHDQPAELPRLSLIDALGKVVLTDGVDQARLDYAELKADRPDDYVFRERELNNLGYQLLGQGHVNEAVGIFRLNQEEYPESANCYDSLAEGLLAQGDAAGALQNYKKALSMDDSLESARRKIEELEGAAGAA